MSVKEQIQSYIASQPEPKRTDIHELHRIILAVQPRCILWFLDGTTEDGKIVSNPNIGYGSYTMIYADGSTREFYQVGLSSTTSGISVYIMGIQDKKYLCEAFAQGLGEANARLLHKVQGPERYRS